MEQIHQEYVDYIRAHEEECRASAPVIAKYLEDHGLIYHGRIMRTVQIPSVFSPGEIEDFRRIVRTTYGIFDKIIRRYLADPEYRALFPFSKELEELILLPRGYDCTLPIARFDIFYHEDSGDFKFCEINTDGTSAMNEDRVICEALDLNPAHRAMQERWDFSSFELFDTWVEKFLAIYATCENKKERPNVAIVDFLDGVSIAEFYEFERRFRAAGLSCEVCEIRDLRYEGGVLLSPSGMPIDAIYRRAVTTDVMAHQDEIGPFLAAVREGKVCLIGAFCTQIVHNKWLFKLLHEEASLSLLSEDEQDFVRRHVPFTALLTEETCDMRDVLEHPEKWVIKPLDSYGASGAFVGCDFSIKEWQEHVRAHTGTDYICQEFVTPYRPLNVDFNEETAALHPYGKMSGLYAYGGELAGIYSRLSDRGIISSEFNGRMNASLVATKKAGR